MNKRQQPYVEMYCFQMYADKVSNFYIYGQTIPKDKLSVCIVNNLLKPTCTNIHT